MCPFQKSIYGLPESQSLATSFKESDRLGEMCYGIKVTPGRMGVGSGQTLRLRFPQTNCRASTVVPAVNRVFQAAQSTLMPLEAFWPCPERACAFSSVPLLPGSHGRGSEGVTSLLARDDGGA